MQAGSIFPCASPAWRKKKKAVTTGEFRPPRKGEWYISGAIPEAYDAKADLSCSYWIARLVENSKCG